MIPGAMLLLATACSHPDKANDPSPPTVFDTTSVSLLADDGENLLLPSDVEIGLDDTLWVLGARSRVASIDLTVPEIRDVWVLDFGFAAADGFIVTPDGQLWVPEANGKRLARIDPETLAVETIDTGFNVLSGSAPREDGGLVLTGTTGSDAGIKLVDSDGQVGDPSSVGGTVGQPYVDGDQVLVTRLDARGQSWLSTYSFPELELVSDVHAPFFGHQLAILSDGKLLMVDTTHIGAYDFESDTWEEGALGVDNHSLYALGDTALVIDLGSTIEHSVAWEVDSSLEVVRTFPTGMHTADAVQDPVTGLYWMNAEDETAVLAFDTEGNPGPALQLGRHVETLAQDPSDPDRIHYTGRLTGEYGTANLRTGTVTSTPGELIWPVAAARSNDTLWVLDHVTGSLLDTDPDTGEARRTLALDLPNTYRVFDDMAWSDLDGTLFITWSATGELLEVDPADGAILSRWTVSETPENAGISGRLELVVDGDQVWTLDTSTGALARVQVGSDAVAATGLADGSPEGALHALWLDEDVIYAAGRGFDAMTLEEDPELEVGADVLFGRDGDLRLGLDTTHDLLTAYDPDGKLYGSHSIPTLERPPDTVWDPDTRTLVYPVTQDAWVYRMELGLWLDRL